MSLSSTPTTAPPLSGPEPSGWRSLGLLNRYHWFVFVVAALGWLADCLDQQLFTLARDPAVTELLGRAGDETARAFQGRVGFYGGLATSIFLVGWATGGLAFGILGDRWGRAKTMMLTILLYSLFTGLSALSVGVWDFAFYRFLTGLGVGGEFAVGVALLAETMPDRARPFTLGLLQAFSAVGNVTAALLFAGLGSLQQQGVFDNLVVAGWKVNAWRVMFLIGVLPALLALVIRRRLQEPERWASIAAKEGSKNLGSYGQLFGHAVWRRHALLGMGLAFAGVVGLWGIGFFSPRLARAALENTFRNEGYEGAALAGQIKIWQGYTLFVQNIGAFFGMFAFSWLTHYTGRRPAFALALVLAMFSTAGCFAYMDSRSDVLWMVPIMGFCQLSLFGGYAIYFPELFPTRLRSTGTSFCYNVGRFVAALGPAALGTLEGMVYSHKPEPIRWAGVTMCSVFVIGLLVLPFLPETRGKPLPE
jgi:MFS family permease